MSGYLRAQRDRFNHHLFAREKFCRGYAWDWMVAQARFNDCVVDVAGKSVNLKRGQFSHSIRFMAQAWNWDKAAVSRFITRLKTETMIETSTETGQIVITICNYERYQADVKPTETPAASPPETAARQQRDSSETKNKDDETTVKEEREAKASLVRSRFSEFWDCYPHRDGKRNRAGAEKAFAKAARRVSEQVIIDGARAAHGDRRVRDGFARDPTTWLNQEGWADEVDPNVHPFPSRRQNDGERLNDQLDALKARLAVQRLE
jgi:hypothetical protein